MLKQLFKYAFSVSKGSIIYLLLWWGISVKTKTEFLHVADALMEYQMENFLQGNVQYRHMLVHYKSLFISRQRSASNEVNDWDLKFFCCEVVMVLILLLNDDNVFFQLVLVGPRIWEEL